MQRTITYIKRLFNWSWFFKEPESLLKNHLIIFLWSWTEKVKDEVDELSNKEVRMDSSMAAWCTSTLPSWSPSSPPPSPSGMLLLRLRIRADYSVSCALLRSWLPFLPFLQDLHSSRQCRSWVIWGHRQNLRRCPLVSESISQSIFIHSHWNCMYIFKILYL